jgi:hypothetical protein
MNNKLLFALLAGLLVSGCVSTPEPLYYWGHYQGELYGHFKGEKGPEEQIQTLEEDAQLAASEGKSLPPGFRAHLGMLYGETGRTDKMAIFLEQEKERFPESTAFVDFLLNSFKRPEEEQ